MHLYRSPQHGSAGSTKEKWHSEDLNRAIQREHYPLPTIEDIATRLHGAKLFTVLDVSKGFWHIELDEPSSLLTQLSTPHLVAIGGNACHSAFVQHQKSFSDASINWSRGLEGVEVVADNFVVMGCGAEATRGHDANLHNFLRRCADRQVKLNPEKVRLREVPFRPCGPSKGASHSPEDVAGVQRLIGMTQYLSKFLPHLSDLTKPLRELAHKDTAWVWDKQQDMALEGLKKVVASAAVLTGRGHLAVRCLSGRPWGCHDTKRATSGLRISRTHPR